MYDNNQLMHIFNLNFQTWYKHPWYKFLNTTTFSNPHKQ